MKKSVAILVSAVVMATPAMAQVRPQDCRPVFPIVDQTAALPQDVIADRVIPAAAAKRSFFGLPFLPLLLAAGGAGLLAGGGGGGGGDVSPD